MYKKLSYRAIIELAAPHTWVASIFPVILAGLLAYAFGYGIKPIFFLISLLISILLQAAVNTINDYVDFVKGADNAESCPDTKDAAIVYHNINPKHALLVGILFITAATILGVILCILVSWWLIAFGIVGVLILVFYSMGPLPISYTPFGEITSGFIMGGIITLATYYVLTGVFSIMVLYYASPLIITIGLIMLTNNSCDIIKDKEADRHTLPIILGAKNSHTLLILGFIFSILIVAHIGFWHFRAGSFIAIIMAIHSFFYIKSYLKIQLNLDNRRKAMVTTLKLVKTINIYYLIIILLGVVLHG